MSEVLVYYKIDEDAAKRAKLANSYFDYVPGSATAAYRSEVDKAIEIAEKQKKRVSVEYHPKIDRLLDDYARKLAENRNKSYRIDASVPSVLVAGGSNFPVRAKQKQNARRDTNMREYEEIQKILDKISSVGMGGIMSDDPNAIEKLKIKLAELEQKQEKMRNVNAYYRKHKTVIGCEDLTVESAEWLEKAMKEPNTLTDQPYPKWALTNNSANIRRIKTRIETLEKEAERAAGNPEEITGNGYTLRENSEIGRIQFVFDGKPVASVRDLLKSWGFRWSPREGAWQRMLNDNGRYAAEQLMKKLNEMEVVLE